MPFENKGKVVYWVATILFLLPTAGSGFPELFTDGPAAVVATMHHLGYPLYLMKILGLAKILGALAILTNRFPRLKEWAYAGFVFDFLGAAASHAIVGDRLEVLFPLMMLPLLALSYFYWEQRR